MLYMSNKLSIYASTHCHPVMLQNDFIIPLQLRKNITGIDLGYLSDDTGDNISDRGISYGGGLPSLYWIWKNDIESDYVGFCQYRRYFLLDEKHNYFQIEYVTNEDGLKKIKFEDKYIRGILEKYDVVLSKKRRFTKSVWNTYARMHDQRDFVALELAIEQVCPEYSNIFNIHIKKGNILPQFGMIVTSKEIFDNFCEWIFPIIYKLDLMKDANKNSLSEPRRIDYIFEHLMPLYFIKHKELKIKHLPIIVADPTKKAVSNFRYLCSQLKTELRFLFNI
ncbi:MAG: hypothetical protein JWN56_2243 [Sphingobacteriales bacterium]|nr:hypothetical protein [Sphingobacteriales bacterium]